VIARRASSSAEQLYATAHCYVNAVLHNAFAMPAHIDDAYEAELTAAAAIVTHDP
jgi:hypothetical protein